MKILKQGAEAILYLTKANTILKKRIPKSYRIKELDDERRKSTIRRELKLLEKASQLENVPKIISSSEENFEIEIEKIDSPLVKDIIDTVEDKQRILISRKIGEGVKKLHNLNIIHGDLTTSNMIYVSDNKEHRKSVNNKKFSHVGSSIKSISREQVGGEGKNDGFKIYLIDFGLGFHSHKIEDKAVDLHLLRQALESKHYKHYENSYKGVLEGYKICNNYSDIIKRLEAVEKRGRYKRKK